MAILSQIDSGISEKLGMVDGGSLEPTLVQRNRNDVVARAVAELTLSHQNRRFQKFPFTVSYNLQEYPMPSPFGNAVYAQASHDNGYTWEPIDIVNFDTLLRRQRDGYPAIAFFGTDPVTARLSWLPQSTPLIEVYYNDWQQPAKQLNAGLPFADLFLTKIILEACVQLVGFLDLPDNVFARRMSALQDELKKWTILWSELINQAPAQSSVTRGAFMGDMYYGPETTDWCY